MRAFLPVFLACVTLSGIASAQDGALTVAQDPEEPATVAGGSAPSTSAPVAEPGAEWGLGFGMTATFHTLVVTGLVYEGETTPRFIVDGALIGAGMGLTMNVSYGAWRVLILRGAYGAMGATEATATFDDRPAFDELGGPSWARAQLGTGAVVPIDESDLLVEGNFSANSLSVRLGEDTVTERASELSAAVYEVGVTLGARMTPFGCMVVEPSVYAGFAFHEATEGVNDVAAGFHVTAGCDMAVEARHRD